MSFYLGEMVSASPRCREGLHDCESTFSFRLRHLLGLALLAGMVAWIYPRGSAAWRLHNLAVVYAEYALCMVGPTGPELLRSDADTFVELARRRLITSGAEDTPFRACHPLAVQLAPGSTDERVHTHQAKEFAEYHHTPGDRPGFSVRQLRPDLAPLHELATQSWPFVRSGVEKLMKPSSHAKEAAHPARVPKPGWGSGLPARRFRYRSTAAFGDTFVAALGSGANARVFLSKNRGKDFRPGGRHLATDLLDRCVVDEEGRAFTLSRLNDGRHIVVSQGPIAAPQIAVLADPDRRIATLSCDASSLVATLVGEPDATGYRPVEIRNCPFRRPCHSLNPPDLAGAPLYYPADVAKIEGDIVLAKAAGGVTRVASSRDGGRSWTSWVVAFDAVSAGVDAPAPHRLLAVADRLFLYSGGESERYPLLVSEDHGASFFAPFDRTSDERKENQWARVDGKDVPSAP